MTLAKQKEMLNLYKKYMDTDTLKIKLSLTKHLNEHKRRHRSYKTIAKKAGISQQTIYQFRKPYVGNKPEFFNVMSLCDVIGVSVEELLDE